MKRISIFLAVAIAGVAGCSDKATDGSAVQGTPAPPLTGAATDAAANAPPPVSSRQALGIGAEKLQEGAAAGRPAQADRAMTSATTGATSQIAPSMLIRTGSASIEVDRLDPAILKVRQLATQLGGYVANSSIAGGREQVRSATLELKIPAARYDQAVSGLGAIGRVESVNTNVDDVGEEYVDLSARAANAKRLEERLVTLLATRTGKLEDVLAVERELARVREEIERFEGRLRYLRTRAAVSTLTITVHEPLPLLGQNPGENPIIGAIRQAWRNFVGFIAWLIASLGVLVPAGAIAVAGWYAYRRIRRRV